MRLVDSKQMQKMDEFTINEIGVPGAVLMENAAASWVFATQKWWKPARRVYVVCGPGNNGGDGYAIARILANRGVDCIVVATKSPKTTDCKANAKFWQSYGVTMEWENFVDLSAQIRNNDLIVDSVLGTGIETPLRGPLIDVIRHLNRLDCRKVAVDIPSGVSASTGDAMGPAIRVTGCVTFQKEKIGHHLYPGKLLRGELICCPIGIKERYEESDRQVSLITDVSAKRLLPKRDPIAHKNRFGHVALICGN
ncbi:MAG: NAD(P)H-hydrate epimerase, partial [Planctomycetes bacterium]|nr:NAD(P)H-hydrate epimerase [Planctomycetota bacterium]